MSSNRNDAKVSGTSNIALTAVALQDHWSRSISLGPKFGPKKVGLGPAAKARQKKEVRSVIDTGFSKGRKLPPIRKEKEEVEYVLDKKPPPLSLAQKFGLVHAPKPLLSETEWSTVKEKSNKREDSGEPCVICKEDFGTQDQVLLSCTHVFHKACLQAFERFTGRKTCPMCRQEQYQTRVIHEGARVHRHRCATRIQSQWRGYVVRSWYNNLRATVPPKDPMLRKKFYEEKMSSIIDRMVNSLDTNMAAFLQEIDASVQHSRQIFSQWDACHVTISDQEWEDIQLKAVKRGDENCPICLTELHHHTTPDNNKDYNHNDDNNDALYYPHHSPSSSSSPSSLPSSSSSLSQQHLRKQSPHSHSRSSQSSTHNNKKQQQLVVNRKLKDQRLFAKISNVNLIPNTITPPEDFSKNTNFDEGTNENSHECQSSHPHPHPHHHHHHHQPHQHKVRSTVLLSCSHVFHSTCLHTLEEMAGLEVKDTCPICRAHYQKKVIVF